MTNSNYKEEEINKNDELNILHFLSLIEISIAFINKILIYHIKF